MQPYSIYRGKVCLRVPTSPCGEGQIRSKAPMEFPVCSFSQDNMTAMFLAPYASDVSQVDCSRSNPVTVGPVCKTPVTEVKSNYSNPPLKYFHLAQVFFFIYYYLDLRLD